MKFLIRKATMADLNSVSSLYDKKGDYPQSYFGKEKREIFSDMLNDNSREILVGEKNGNVSAFLSMKIEHRFENSLKTSTIIFDIKAKDDETEILCAVLSRAIAITLENGGTEIILLDKNVTACTNSVYSICGFRKSDTCYIKSL